MGRCVMVLGVPRSGTSAIAGVLHHLGINMGNGHLQGGNEWNPKGYYEDLRWQKLNKQVTGERYGHKQPAAISKRQAEQYKALAELCDVDQLWGMKDPRLCFTAQFIWPWLTDARIVVVLRNPSASALSLMAHSQENYGGRYAMTLEEATRLRDLWADAREARLHDFWGPVLRIQFEELCVMPEMAIQKVARFAFDGLRFLTPDVKAASSFIDPRLNHHD